jgi:aminoglycoside phosphotransferase (APT) family kinase protein
MERAPCDTGAVLERLRALPDLSGLTDDAIEALPTKGVSHDHLRLIGHGLVLRIPRLSQLGLDAVANLAYQAAAFRRLEPSEATPRLAAVLEPDAALPSGALLVADVPGGPPRLPTDLPALARSLAAVHSLPVPEIRAPLTDAPDPVAAIWVSIRAGLDYASRAALHPESARILAQQTAWVADFAASDRPEQPIRTVLTDTHPGNFLVADGRAVMVDLEKAGYGSPAVDLAHLTLPTSTGWDPDVATMLDGEAIARAEAVWLEAVDSDLAHAVLPWLAPMRRLTWLRTLTFFLKWRVESRVSGAWSAERLGISAAEHFRTHIAASLEPDAMRQVLDDLM